MDERLREELRSHIAVALAVAPKGVRRALWNYQDPRQEEAQRTLSRAIADAVLRAYEVTRKDDAAGPGLHAR